MMSTSDPYAASTPKLSALIIGINRYKHKKIPHLHGAVNDAQAMKKYLMKELGVPQGRIIYLENQKATRAGIIDGFAELRNLPGLVPGSPILIYLAGHGTRVRVDDDIPEEMETDASVLHDNDKWAMIDVGLMDQMEAFVPYDCDGLWNGSIHPILDKTISCLVESVYNVVGNNIVIISDCCYSGSMTRGPDIESQYNVRRLDTPASYRYPMSIDSKLISKILPDGSIEASHSTHVLLAACGAGELAGEAEFDGEWHGYFTRALLTLFQSIPIGRLTPDDVPIRFAQGTIPKQSPQCVGDNCMRPFFRGGASVLMWYRVTRDVEGNFQVNGGLLHGISNEATFKIFRERSSSEYVGIAKVNTLVAFQSTIEPMDKWILPPNSGTIHPLERGFALLHNVGDFVQPRVFIEEETKTWPISRALENLSRLNQMHPVRGKSTESCFSLKEKSDGTITIANLDPRLSFPESPDILPIPIPSDADKLRDVLAHAAQFFFHLDNGISEARKLAQIQVEIVEVGDVEKTSTGFGRVTRRRDTSEDLLKEGRLFVTDRQESRQPLHGIKIKNSSDQDWFVSIFYFNGADHTISRLYGCSCATQYKVDPCIPRKSEQKLGFQSGSQDMKALKFQVSGGRHREFGAYKFIFTSVPVNFANISSTTSLPAVASRGFEEYELPAFEIDKAEWGTLCIPVVITRGKKDRVVCSNPR
ncbi:caspase domain-containing protein [Crepidotus variabilis]|uniref:Caspase domain-containing protein n=1 Tax=Crepidotus variabilis TaxID=179855 RepID=A0A9P6JR77_9AGAR|nr:caspase domain-containing protein [Crepidotus variabilis]